MERSGMFCSKCGKEVSPKDKFCKKCGQVVLDLTDQKVDQKEEEQKTQQPAQKPKTSCCCSFFILVIIFGILGFMILGFSAANKKNNISTPTPTAKTATPKPKAKATTTPKPETDTVELNGEQAAPAEESAPASQPETAKQLYYSVGCSNCSATVCQRSYSYSGYDEGLWLYYKDMCNLCSCLDIKSQSIWR